MSQRVTVVFGAILPILFAGCGSDQSQFAGGGGSPNPPPDRWEISQLTSSPQPTDDYLLPSVSATGRVITFISAADPLGGNVPRTTELFLRRSDGSGLSQLTTNLRASGGVTSQELADAGDRVVFVAQGEYSPGSNPDGESEVFVVDATGQNLRQLTQSPQGFPAFGARISSDGARVAFISRANFTCSSCDNPDQSQEVFMINADGTSLSQVTRLPAATTGVERISLAGDGSVIALELAGDPLGLNPDGSREIFLINSNGTGLRQLTASPLDSSYPSVSADGAIVAFQSVGDLVLGGNPNRIPQVYVVNGNGSGLGQLTRVASSAEGAGFAWGGGLSADGKVVNFTSDADLVGANSQLLRTVFQVNLDNTGLQQVVANPPLSSADRSAIAPSPSADGKVVAFQSRANFSESNGDGGTEIFLARWVAGQ